MSEGDYLAERFEEHRSHLRGVAYRMLGSSGEVDDCEARAAHVCLPGRQPDREI
jgi:hypothetical protein